MPVNVLYCEGNYKSIDIQIIREILPKNCEIRPIGGKQLFVSSILGDRAINPNLAGLLDRDFDCQNMTLKRSPCPIFTSNNIQVGWSWERKEIENYLLDPEVVQRALERKAPPINEYQSALMEAAKSISNYTAARTALSCYGFKNFWGEKVSNTSHCFPRRLGREACEQNIQTIVQQLRGDRIVTPENVLDKFRRLVPLFQPGGNRFENFLTFFAGKDLLCIMTEKLRVFGFESSNSQISPRDVFLERIIKGMERKQEVWIWLEEWRMLRELIINTDFSTTSPT
ncbi:hypothetical protein F7734_26940 [Scytonema sp. UIC 10036]|uniref:hypothetical protein n=1 Tax=Scytonema sp. UIC 10036 TaxID=2304196 RepID=UPI00137FDCD4|nr:hypothetical protein [Scytonema sp. UIC 10036]MUG95796.1 hypothetical protein [Scytonema sp. UIC 10036]